MQILENVDISKMTTLKIGGKVKYFVYVKNLPDLKEVYVRLLSFGLPVVVLGGGSNTVFPDGVLDISVLKISILGFEIIKEDHDGAIIAVGAGENWDSLVEKTVGFGLSGLEPLSAIPGSVGGTPVQNVGAYGQEVKNLIEKVLVFDVSSGEIISISNEECKFTYRDSMFKHEGKNKYIICSVFFLLSKKPPVMPNYPGVKKYFEEMGKISPTLKEIRRAIISIRKEKLPDPSEIPSAGSFFKNPIVSEDILKKLKIKFPEIVSFPAVEGKVKLSAGWLIDRCELKGLKINGGISVYEKNALVLINSGNATYADISSARDFVIEKVRQKFGIILEAEPVF